MIVYAGASLGGLLRVSAAGGDPEVITTTDEGRHQWPDVLPGGAGVLFTVDTVGLQSGDEQIAVLDYETGAYEVIIPNGSHPKYSPTGHIVYGVAGTLRAVAFDLETLTVTSDPVPVVEGVLTRRGSALVRFDLPQPGRWCTRRALPRSLGDKPSCGWTARVTRNRSHCPRAFTGSRVSPRTEPAWLSSLPSQGRWVGRCGSTTPGRGGAFD